MPVKYGDLDGKANQKNLQCCHCAVVVSCSWNFQVLQVEYLRSEARKQAGSTGSIMCSYKKLVRFGE